MKLGIELDGILADPAATIDMFAPIYYGPHPSPTELAQLPDALPFFYAEHMRLRPGVVGQLLRVREAEPRLDLSICSTRPERFQSETKAWLRRWIPDRISWTLLNTPDFGVLPMQVWVVTEERKAQLKDHPRVYTSIGELGFGVQERLL